MAKKKRRNHYVPRYLLNRFASRVKGDTRFVWQYSKGRAPIEISTKDAGVEAFFYGEPANGLENQFETVETVQAITLAKLDRGESPDTHAEVLRQLIWTLSIRTRALREQYASVHARLFDHLEQTAGGEDAKQAFAAETAREFDRLLLEQVDKWPSGYRERALQLLESIERRDAFRSIALSQLEHVDVQAFIGWLRREFGAQFDFKKCAADGQIRGIAALLDRGDAPVQFAPAYWQVVTRPSGTFVLGDGCVVAADTNNRIATLIALGNAWQSVYLPISDKAVLVGARCPIDRVLPDERINLASAELGSSVFFASQCTLREKEYATKIGSGVPLIADAELTSIVEKSWRDLKDGNTRPDKGEAAS